MAHKVCESFDMILASPRNQDEYDNIGHLLRDYNEQWDLVAIAGYRSETNNNVWVHSNGKINYTIDWNSGEPNNDAGVEDCIGKKFL